MSKQELCPACDHPSAEHEIWGCRHEGCHCDVINGKFTEPQEPQPQTIQGAAAALCRDRERGKLRP